MSPLALLCRFIREKEIYMDKIFARNGENSGKGFHCTL